MPLDLIEDKLEIGSQEDLPGADCEEFPAPVLVDFNFVANDEDPSLVGIRPSNHGGHYKLALESWTSATRLTSDPYEVQGLPLLYGFVPEPNDPNGFCPYTTQRTCPVIPFYSSPETYWGMRFVYLPNANLVGYAWGWYGSLPETLHGDSYGLAISVVGKTLNVAGLSRCAGDWRSVKWEGYDGDIDEPAAEPYFWGPHDPLRDQRTNICDYPQAFWGVVPDHVVPETTGAPYQVDVEATAAIDPNVFPGFKLVYRRTGLPVYVTYNRTDVSR